MRSSKSILSILRILGACALTQRVSSRSITQSKRIMIVASAVIDGKGHVLPDTRIVIGASKIVAIDPDVHGHIGRFFGQDGKLAGAGGPSMVETFL